MSADFYRFTIAEGVVTAFFEIEDGVAKAKTIETGETLVVDGNQVIYTEIQADGSIETKIFDDADGDRLYVQLDDEDRADDDRGDDHIGGHIEGGASHGAHKEFTFEIVNGEVVRVFEHSADQIHEKSIDGDETYAIVGDEIIRTELKPFGQEITHYADPDLDGFYTRVSEQWIMGGTTPGGATLPSITRDLTFVGSDGDDFLAVREGDDSHGGTGADAFVFREATRLRIEDFHRAEGDRLVFDTALGLQSREHLASFVTELRVEGSDLIVSFGADVSITLVGVTPGNISWDDIDVLS